MRLEDMDPNSVEYLTLFLKLLNEKFVEEQQRRRAPSLRALTPTLWSLHLLAATVSARCPPAGIICS